jgi:hypothetical protein
MVCSYNHKTDVALSTTYKQFLNDSLSLPRCGALQDAIHEAEKEKLNIESMLSDVLRELNREKLSSESHILAKKIITTFAALQLSAKEGYHRLNQYQMFEISAIAESLLKSGSLDSNSVVRVPKRNEPLSHSLLIDFQNRTYTILLGKDGLIQQNTHHSKVRSGIEISVQENDAHSELQATAKHVAKKTAEQIPERKIEYEKKYGGLRSWAHYISQKEEKKTIITMEAYDFTLEEETNIPMKAKLSIVRDITEKLAEMHNDGVIHGDLKPNNLMVQRENEEYRGKMIDFELCYQPLHGETQKFKNQYGTVNFSSPEALENAMLKNDGEHTLEREKSQDMYALGITLLEFFLFDEKSTFGRPAQKWYEEAAWIVLYGADLSYHKEIALEQIVMRKEKLSAKIKELSQKSNPSSKERLKLCIYKLLDPNPETRTTAQQLLTEIDELSNIL